MDVEATYAACLLECGWPKFLSIVVEKWSSDEDEDATCEIATTDYIFKVCHWWNETLADEPVSVITGQAIRPIAYSSSEFTRWWGGYKRWLLEARNAHVHE